MNKQEWISALRLFAEVRRQQHPIPCRETLSQEEQWQCRIIGAEFQSWYRDHLPAILREREALSIMEFDRYPCIVLTTTMPGLVAVREIRPEPPDNLIYLMHSEYTEWLAHHPVDKFNFHIHHWSYLNGIDRTSIPRARLTHLKVSPEQYRIHTRGNLWGVRCGEEEKHLWRWNGENMELLEEAFSQSRF